MSGGLSPHVSAIRARFTTRVHEYSVRTFLSRPFHSIAASSVSSSPISARIAVAAGAQAPRPSSSRLSGPGPGPGNKMSSSSSSSSPAEPRPSSSVLLLSPGNEILLVHRVKTSSTFPSAHVFPGGNLDAFHDGEIPDVGTLGRYRDGLAYRLGAIRETFEETGILLARRRRGGDNNSRNEGGSSSGELVDLPQSERDEARKRVHGNKIKFTEWLASIGAEADTDGLVPFTRWITPVTNAKRFTTQMYLYFLPISRSSSTLQAFSQMLVPTSDGGLEHTAADFASPSWFLSRADADEIILFPPQYYLLHHLAQFLTPTAEDEQRQGGSTELEAEPARLAGQRRKLLSFVHRLPTAKTPAGRAHATSWIPWGDKCIGPLAAPLTKGDKRMVFSLDDAGAELRGSDRGGDWESVVIGEWGKNGPCALQVCSREEVLSLKGGEGALKKQKDSKL